jgi:hypothetical protein
MSRKMQRNEIKRIACSKAGKKGGNPKLLYDSKQMDLLPTLKHEEKAVTEPEPKTDVKKGTEIPSDTAVGASESPTKHKDSAAELFADAFATINQGMKYRWRDGDFVQLAKLRKDQLMPNGDIPKDWPTAVANYFASQDSPKRTIADLCTRFEIFAMGPLDRFGKRPAVSTTKRSATRSANDVLAEKIKADIRQKKGAQR